MEMERPTWIESIDSLTKHWKDSPEIHQQINEEFISLVNSNPSLKALRDWVEQNIWGFGERSFYWMWKLLVDQMPQEFTFMEIGVFRGQILALIQLLATMQGKTVKVIGLSPMSTEGDYWESDYEKDVERIHNQFNLPNNYEIIKESSQTITGINKAFEYNQKIDLFYIDGGHEYDMVVNDINNYSRLIKPEGYLVMDDCCNKFELPFGYFRGHEPVSQAVDQYLPPFTTNPTFEFLFSVVHNRVWRKK